MNYHGSYAMGAIISGCENVVIGDPFSPVADAINAASDGVAALAAQSMFFTWYSQLGATIYDINAPYGAAVGLAVNNKCDNIEISNTNIYDLTSCSSCFDSATFVIDEQSKNITSNLIQFNPASTTPVPLSSP